MKQCKCLIFIAFDCHLNIFMPLIEKYKKSFEKFKKIEISHRNCQNFEILPQIVKKGPVFITFLKKIFLKSNNRP